MLKIKNKDSKWGDMFMTSMFLGIISAFLGMVFSDIRSGIEGFIPIFVLLVSPLTMAICGLLIKKLNWKWLETYEILHWVARESFTKRVGRRILYENNTELGNLTFP